MTRSSRIRPSSRSRWLWAAAAVALGIAAGSIVALRGPGAASPAGSPGAASSPGSPGAAASSPSAPAAPRPALPAAGPRGGEVAITGRVIDVQQQRPVGSVEVVFLGAAGEATATTRPDGSYALRVAPGSYRAFVRGGGVMSISRRDPARVPGPPSPEIVGVPDEALLTAVVAAHDTDGVDLAVARGGTVAGRVVDRAGRPIGGAVVYASGGALRPALATDIARSADDGRFELQLPPGGFELAASHPRFAGIAPESRTRYIVRPEDRLSATLVLVAGCIVSGRVTGPGGEPAGDGALELQNGPGEADFMPAGRIDPDGTFRWSTTAEADIALRAWPWKSPPSPVRQFRCRDGARFDDVVFELPDRRPDLEGVLVDKAGRPVGFSFVDLRPLEPGEIAQQERTDGSGRWEVYSMPPGRYRVTAQAGGGVASTTVVSPRGDIRLELGGTGRLEGTAPRLASGSFELALDSCVADGELIPLAQSRRLVTVTGGRFATGDLPACELGFSVIWRGQPVAQHAAIPAGGTARIELAIGELHEKTVHGVVRDAAGQPVAGAAVSAARPDDDARTAAAITDAAGGYTIRTVSGATLRASAHGQAGEGRVGGANVDDEQVDLRIGASDDDEPPR